MRISTGINMKIRKSSLFSLEPFASLGKPLVPMSSSQLNLAKELNGLITKNRVVFEEVPCLCGSQEFELIASVDRYTIIQSTVICVNCGLIQSNPRMTQEQYRDFYSSDFYRRCYEGEDYIHAFDEKKYNDSSVMHIFDEVNKARKITHGITVIELGAGGGWNLLPFIKAGAVARGVEYSPSLVELGRKHGIDMVQGDVVAISGIYDVVILSHVLEHLPDPVGSLKNIAKHMHEGSIIYVGVPNIMNFSMVQLQSAHTYYFTPWTFEYFCSQAGLKLVMKGPAQGIHMFGIFKKGASLKAEWLKRHYLKMRWYLKSIALKYHLKVFLSKLRIIRQ